MRRTTSPARHRPASEAASARVASAESVVVCNGHAALALALTRSRRPHEALGPDEVRPHLGHGLATGPQGVRRVVRRHQKGVAALEDLPAQLPDAPRLVEQQLGGEVAEGDDHLRLDQRDLRGQIRPARFDLDRRRVAVVRRSALHDVRDVALGPGQPDLLRHEPVEQLAGASDEGLAGQVLLAAGPLAHEEQVGCRVPHAEDHLCAPRRQRAQRAGGRGDAQPLELGGVRHRRWGG